MTNEGVLAAFLILLIIFFFGQIAAVFYFTSWMEKKMDELGIRIVKEEE